MMNQIQKEIKLTGAEFGWWGFDRTYWMIGVCLSRIARAIQFCYAISIFNPIQPDLCGLAPKAIVFLYYVILAAFRFLAAHTDLSDHRKMAVAFSALFQLNPHKKYSRMCANVNKVWEIVSIHIIYKKKKASKLWLLYIIYMPCYQGKAEFKWPRWVELVLSR